MKKATAKIAKTRLGTQTCADITLAKPPFAKAWSATPIFDERIADQSKLANPTLQQTAHEKTQRVNDAR